MSIGFLQIFDLMGCQKSIMKYLKMSWDYINLTKKMHLNVRAEAAPIFCKLRPVAYYALNKQVEETFDKTVEKGGLRPLQMSPQSDTDRSCIKI